MTPNPTDRDGLVLHARLDALATAVDQHGLNGKRFREHVSATIRQAAAALREDARDAERYDGIRRILLAERIDAMPPIPDQKNACTFDAWVDAGIATFDAAMQTPSGDGGGG